PINNVPDGSIPDVPMDHPQAKAIYKLYRAGILEGSGDQHLCNPNANIKRSEVAAILTRMMDPNARRHFEMK
ncbi:MAG: S-layer homology domain-containing protein, partial [Firmicutes bacterium]|nr:S-layer homology domain-containing protein [Bacillota bacterium]